MYRKNPTITVNFNGKHTEIPKHPLNSRVFALFRCNNLINGEHPILIPITYLIYIVIIICNVCNVLCSKNPIFFYIY